MTTEAFFLQAILADPGADDCWLVLADWLEEQGEAPRAELVRLQLALRRESRWRPRGRPEKRVIELLAAGVKPCVPTLVNSVGIELALVPAGVFWMGSTRNLAVADDDEFPRHRVEITRPFLLGVHPVTQEQYEKVMGENPSYFAPGGSGRNEVKHLPTRLLPVENVSYRDLQQFCKELSRLPQEMGRDYRLPTEAEWEYACRGCVCSSAYAFGPRLTRKEARFGGMGGAHPVPIGSYRPNLFGLHDMHGNVWEWCADWFDPMYYRSSPAQDPTGPASGDRRVLRGGGWSTPVTLCRSALRGHNNVGARHSYNGFRVALSVPTA